MSSFEKVKTFIKEVRVETRKVNWPRWDELKESTTVVLVAVFIITAFISVVDVILNNLLNLFMKIG